jgi:AcrR family transcriptional regulator
MIEAKRNGRPPVADSDELRSRAIEVLQVRGFGDTTMAALALELGVSTRTLHRYFPSKADIVWGGIEHSLDALREGFAEADDELPILDAIADVINSVFHQDTDETTLGRVRLRLIATTPELWETRPETYRAWRDETVSFIARRLGTTPDDVVPQAVGAAMQTAITEALRWWATHPTTSAVESVMRALRGFEVITAR